MQTIAPQTKREDETIPEEQTKPVEPASRVPNTDNADKKGSNKWQTVLLYGGGTLVLAAAAFLAGRESQSVDKVNVGTDRNPTPTARPGAMPSQTAISSGQRESIVDHEMKDGETYQAKNGSIVKGDVFVDGIRYFDDNGKTGLIIELHKNAKITAPYGANVSYIGADQTTRNAVIGQAVEEMKAKGCDKGLGCSSGVSVIPVPGGKPQDK